MSNENSKNPASASDGQEQPKHESWVKHIVNEIKEEISTMEDIFKLQKMYELKTEEEMIKQNLKKMGYIN